MRLRHGDIVLINTIYRRRKKLEWNGYTNVRKKFWMPVPIPARTGIYLGTRTLCNGITEWEDEVGNVFIPEREGYIKALLVSFSTNENPVYAPYDESVHA